MKVWDALSAKGVASTFRQRLKEWAAAIGSQGDYAIREEKGDGGVIEVQPDDEIEGDEEEEEDQSPA